MADDTTKPAEPRAEDAPAPDTSDGAGTAVATEEKPAAPPKKKKKNKRTVPYGQLHVLATFNNTIITFTDQTGAVLTQASAGGCGFRGSKKGTAYAAQIASEKAANAVKQQYGMSKVDVFVKGIGQGRETAIRALANLDLNVESIRDVTPVAHGGVRPRKARRN